MSAQAFTVLTCKELEPTLEFFVGRLKFQLLSIFPADSPRQAVVSGYGLQLILRLGAEWRGELRIRCDEPVRFAKLLGFGQASIQVPNGWSVVLEQDRQALHMPPTQQELVFTPYLANAAWGVGRAGLRYRDLLPSRLGGAFIASHIRLLEGGPVPDYVHYHLVRFQLIYCRKGWVDVLYEGQGDTFRMQEGDCVLQPPTIRHRVVASSQGAEVVEVVGPAEHMTLAEQELTLPSGRLPSDHFFGKEYFGGQQFVWAKASDARWGAWRTSAFEASDSGITNATGGLASVKRVRCPDGAKASLSQEEAFCLLYVLSGGLKISANDKSFDLNPDDCMHLPNGLSYAIEASAESEFLEVVLQGE